MNVVKSKAKPEGVSEADWNRRKSALLSRGYYTAGVTGCMRQVWKDCDTNLREALPMVSGQPAMAGPTYFYLGVANYQISKITTDRTKLQEALKFSATIGGHRRPHAVPGAAVRDRHAKRIAEAGHPAVAGPGSLHFAGTAILTESVLGVARDRLSQFDPFSTSFAGSNRYK